METIKNQYGNEINFNEAVKLMDDYVRESVAATGETDTEQEFFDAYCAMHKETYNEDFYLNTSNPTY